MKNANIFIYQLGLIYLQYHLYLDIDSCVTPDKVSYMDVCIPKGNTLEEKVKTWDGLNGDLKAMNEYRYFELVIFYSQLAAITIYIVFCKVFLQLKKQTGTFDLTDPFQKILQNKNKDLLEKENFYMITIVL